MITKQEFINFANENEIPMMLVFDDTKIPSSDNIPMIVCFEKDIDKVKHVTPVTFLIESVPNQIEYTQKKLIECVENY